MKGIVNSMLFQEINIWEKKYDNEISLYKCIKLIEINKYTIKNKNYYYSDEKGNIDISNNSYFEKVFLERLLDFDISNLEEYDLSDSIEEAIEKFNNQDW